MEQALRVRAVQTRRSRQPIPFQKLSWRKSPLTKAFVESSMYGMPPPTMTTPPTMPTDDVAPQYNWRPCEMNPALVIRKILVLFEYHRHDEVAHIIRAITDQTLKAIATELPIALFIDGVPRTLPIIDAVYTRVFLSAGVQRFPFNLMQPESVIMQLIRLFAHSDEPSAGQHNAKWTTSDVAACKNVLRIIAQVDPKLPKMLKRRKRALDKALEGLGMHGMVITPDQNLLNLHDALKVEFTNAIRNYRDVLEKLGDLELTKAKMKTRSIGKGTPPVEASHQRLLNLTHGEITERLTKNKIVWTTVEPVLYGSKLPALLNTLKERIETDKEAIYQFSQMRKEAGHLSHNTIVAPILMQYARGFDRILLLLCEVCDDSVSGYHSDSDSGGLNSGSRNTYHSIGLSNGSRGSSENLRTMGSNDSGRGNSLEGSTSKRDAVVGYSGPLGSSSNSSKGIPSVAESSTDSHYSAELGTLKHEVHGLRLELVKSKEVIVKLQQKEHAMIERLSDQARRQLERGSKFENLSLGEQRPTQLIRQYGNLYMQVRVEALDALDNLREMDDSDDLKSKLAFSVVVLSFRSVRSTIEQKKAALRHILGIPSIGSGGSSDPAVTDMLESIGYYMRKSTEKYDIRPNVQDVCSQLYSTLFDFPSLSTCHGLTAYIEECVKLAWALSNQIPAYCIEYDANAYNANFHERFHNSNPYSDHVISYLWPALREGEKGPCVYKAIVIT